MDLRRTLMLGALAVSIAACATAPKVEYRLSKRAVPGPDTSLDALVAQGNGQLALGNAGLALETFRRAARNDPSNVAALTGIASSYDRMGRFDLSRRYIETALAHAPGDPALLARYAATLDADGDRDAAAAVRHEMALRAEGEPIAAITQELEDVPPAPALERVAQIAQPDVPATPHEPAPKTRLAPEALAIREKLSVAPPPASPSRPLRREVALEAPLPKSAPRLVRLSMGEVALVTGNAGIWSPPQAPVKVETRTAKVELLNAARVSRLAARTRILLSSRGFNGLSVGDADSVRETSVVFYPAAQSREADRLARALGCNKLLDPRAANITVLLGRDSAARLESVPKAG